MALSRVALSRAKLKLNLIFHFYDGLLLADSVEKVDLLLGLRQNQVIGQREDS